MTQLIGTSGNTSQSGTYSFAVTAGDQFGFYIEAQEAAFGANSGATISSFDAPTSTPEPASFALFGIGAALLALQRRKRV